MTYKGGNNHKHERFYADRHVNKPSVHHGNPVAHNNKPAVHNNDKNWRNAKGSGHFRGHR